MSLPSNIVRFSILGLFGEKDVNIDFSSRVTILIADNGIGKTTILSIIYAVLSGQLYRLRRVEFKEIVVQFSDNTNISIKSEVIQPSLELSRADPRIRRLMQQVPESVIYQLFEETRGLDYISFRRHPLVREVAEMGGMPHRYLFDSLHSPTRQEQLLLMGEGAFPEAIREQLARAFPFPVLYYPTYRRIEEDLEHLGYERKEGSRAEALIQFGMSDVDARVANITEQIKNSSVAWYSKINGQMLSQFVDGIRVDDSARQSVRDKDALKIVLDRIGENISAGHKQHIIELVHSGRISEQRYDLLTYFLSNLLKIYDQQRELDNSIKAFTRVCNKYLVDKEVIYNESDVRIGIFQKWNKKQIDLPKLSSGEKQIISLFSRLYLEVGGPLAVLFDEPELSLSIEWQRMLLPDIMEAGRCQFLLATTHSPFVFENEFDANARDLGQFITRIIP